MTKVCTEVTSTNVLIHLKDKHIRMSLETQNNSVHKQSTTDCNRMRAEKRRGNVKEKSIVL